MLKTNTATQLHIRNQTSNQLYGYVGTDITHLLVIIDTLGFRIVESSSHAPQQKDLLLFGGASTSS